MRATQFASLLAAATTAYAQAPSLSAALSSSPDLSNLTALLGAFPALTASLGNATNVTLLAPSNDAFTKLAGTDLAGVIAANDTAAITALVSYHVLNGTINSTQITDTPAFVPTHLTDPAFTNVTDGQVVEALSADGNVTFYTGLLSNSTVTQADVAFTGGIIHVIDTFLVPPVNISTTAVAFGLSSAAGALLATDLVDAVDTLADVTAFIPSNEAFEAIGSALQNTSTDALATILQYHIVNGTVAYSTDVTNTTVPTLQGNDLTLTVSNGSIFVNQAKVIVPNVLVANGVVHVIDGVLNPNATSAAPSQTSAAFAGATSGTAVPFTSGVPTPTATIAIPSAATGAAGAGSSATQGGSGSSSASSAGAARATEMAMGAVGAGALFAGAWMGF